MAILKIRTFGDPGLRQRASEVEKITDTHRALIRDMLDTMRAAPGVGLAGPQIGVLERVFVWEVEDEYGAVFNPVIVERSEETFTDEEGCLSIPGLAYQVERNFRILVEGLDENGDPVRFDIEDHHARVFQHEIDHLDGILFIDRLPESHRREAMRRLSEQALGLAPTGSDARGPL